MHRLSRRELVWRQPGRHAGAGPQPLRPRYGFYVDHAADAFGTFFLLGGLALSGLYEPERIAIGLLIVYFMLSIQVYLAAYTLGPFHLSFWKFSPTELRMLLMQGTSRFLQTPLAGIFGREFLLFDIGGAIGIAGMAAMLVVRDPQHGAALPERTALMEARPETARGLGVRWLKFNLVGGIGIGVRLAALALLVGLLKMNYLWATALAVEAAVLHNFVWHERYTWRDRTRATPGVPGKSGALRPDDGGVVDRGKPGADAAAGEA